MKKLLLAIMVAVLAAAATSCDVSKEAKIKTLVGEYVQNHLFIPDSYDPVEFMIDSAFTPRLDPEFWEFMMDAREDLESAQSELSSCEFDIESAERNMSYYEDMRYYGGLSSYERRAYNRAKDELAEHKAEKAEIEEEIRDIKSEIKDWMNVDSEFIGYIAIHSYRAKNNMGNVLMGSMICFIDKDMTHVVTAYDPESMEFKRLTNFMEQINDGDIDLDE